MAPANGKKLFGKVAFALGVTLVILITALYLYNIVKWADYPDFGFGWRTATGIDVVGTITENGRKAGLQLGDRFVEVNGGTFKNIGEFRALMRRNLGDENTYLIERKGRTFAVTIKNVPTGFKRAFGVSGFPYLVGLCYALIGTLVFLMKPHTRPSWIFFLFASTFGLFLTFLYKFGLMRPFWLENVNIFAYTFTPALFIHLALCFPQERRLVTRHPFVQGIPYLVSALLFLRVRSLTPTMTDAPKLWLMAAVGYMALGVLAFLGSCLQLRLASVSQIVKLRARMILLGFAVAASLPLVDLVSNAVFRVYLVPSFNYYLPFFIVFPLFVGYSIVKHDLFDIDAIIKRTYGYVLTTGLIAGAYGVFVFMSNLAFGRFEIMKSPVFPLVFVLAVVFLFNPIRNRLQKFIDRVFYRLEYDYRETVQMISESMRSLLSLDKIVTNVMETALGVMFIDSGRLLLLNRQKGLYECHVDAGKREIHHQDGSPERPSASEGRGEDSQSRRIETDSEAEKVELIKEAERISRFDLPADDPFIRKVAERKRELNIYDVQEDPFFQDHREACDKRFKQLEATLVVPLIYEEDLIGLISLGEKKSGKFYRREDINLLKTLANQGAVAIENALLLEEMIEKERMEEELAIAHDLQTSMLPAACPEVKGFKIAAFSVAAREVGGDFFDFIEMGEERLGLVIGDVTGKSVSGALVMSASRSVFRMLSEQDLSVGEIMLRANRRTKKDIKSGMFVALLYAVLDSKTKAVSLCSAGQTQPVHFTGQTGEARLIDTEGDKFPLGILEEAEYRETQIPLAPGDKVVFYTDGIVEAMNEKEEMFGFERLLEVVKGSGSLDAESLLKEVLGKVNDFVGNAPQHDDLTVIVAGVEQ